jgi:hypothetical protein
MDQGLLDRARYDLWIASTSQFATRRCGAERAASRACLDQNGATTAAEIASWEHCFFRGCLKLLTNQIGASIEVAATAVACNQACPQVQVIGYALAAGFAREDTAGNVAGGGVACSDLAMQQQLLSLATFLFTRSSHPFF